MRLDDLLRLALSTVKAHRLRSVLSMLGIAIGIAAVILLTSIGEGTRRYILSQFSQFVKAAHEPLAGGQAQNAAFTAHRIGYKK